MVYVLCDGDVILCVFEGFDDAYNNAVQVADDLGRPVSEFTVRIAIFCKK